MVISRLRTRPMAPDVEGMCVAVVPSPTHTVLTGEGVIHQVCIHRGRGVRAT